MFSGAINDFTGEPGKTVNHLNGEMQPYNEVARAYMAAGENWVVVGDTNYGEGSSREHAAMSPRHMGGLAVITRSFARIHETNLKKPGLLPLTFAVPADYELVREGDRIDLLGLTELAPGSAVRLVLHHRDGSVSHVELRHSLNAEQISWFKAGSALNFLRQ